MSDPMCNVHSFHATHDDGFVFVFVHDQCAIPEMHFNSVVNFSGISHLCTLHTVVLMADKELSAVQQLCKAFTKPRPIKPIMLDDPFVAHI